MENQKTFKNLLLLKKNQEYLKGVFGLDYEDAIKPFLTAIQFVMQSKGVNEFEALKSIKEESSLYQKPNAENMFAAALMEITEETRFSEFVK